MAKAFSATARKNDSGCFRLFINNTLKAGFRLEGIEIHIIKHGHRMLENRWNVYGIDRLVTHKELLYHRAIRFTRGAPLLRLISPILVGRLITRRRSAATRRKSRMA